MTTLNIRTQGAKVGRRGERLIISKQGELLEQFPLGQIEQVVLFGNVQLTTQATATLLNLDIDVVFMSFYGKFRGRLQGVGSKQAKLRHAQLQKMSDNHFNLKVAKAIVEGKIHNQRVLLQRQTRRISPTESANLRQPANPQVFQRALQGMIKMQRASNSATTLDQLRGYEGKAAAYYFEAIRTLIDSNWGFKKRQFYPAPDPFNALLSFSYSLLQKEVTSSVKQVGFDLYLGLFHEIDYGRPSLALDLMEEWRPLVSDAMVLHLTNRKIITPQHFQRTRNPKRPVQLNNAGRDHILRAYGHRLETKLHHPLAGGQTTLAQAIIWQTRRLGHLVLDKTNVYEAYKAK